MIVLLIMPGENRLLIIGIDDYGQNPLYQSLSNPKRDVERFAKILRDRYGFVFAYEPLLDSDATSDNIKDALIDLTRTSSSDDNVIIYFAGHGDQHSSSKKGYWIPSDGHLHQRLFINNSLVLDEIEAIISKHVLLISDCCYSGTFISQSRGGGKILTPEELDALPSRWVFASGEETTVSDGVSGKGSPFGISLCEFLEKNETPVISAAEIFNEVIRMVELKYPQKPQASYIRSDKNEGGQMIFRLTSSSATDGQPIPVIPFPLPEPKIEYYIPRQLAFYDHQQVKEIWFFNPDVGKIYLNELVLTQKRVVILGAAGSGKSIELLQLAHQLQLAPEGLNPIYKRFNTYTEEDIQEYLPKNWQESDPGNLLVMLDGLDEIPPQFFQTAIRKIIAFSEENPLIRVLISCRNNFYDLPYENFSGTLEGFTVYNLLDISITEVKNYVTKTFHQDGSAFIELVYERGYYDFVQKPFFLNILIKYYLAHGNLVSDRSVLMEEALFAYYINDKIHFNATVKVLSRTMALRFLERIAFVLEVLGKNFLTDDELEQIYPDISDQDQCKYLPAFSRNPDLGQWLFEHNNIQEYIASRVLARKTFKEIISIISVETGIHKKVKPSWVNTLSFFISISDDVLAQELLNWIIEHDIEVIVKFEIDRINSDRRFKVFKEIIEFYNNKDIWIYSNNFSEKELARFSESEASLGYLLAIIDDQLSSRIIKHNALNVLRHFKIDKFLGREEDVKKAVLDTLKDDNLSGSDIYSILGTVAELKVTDRKTIEYLIGRYGQRRNQYVRAGLYKLLVKSDLADEYIDVFIDGIDLKSLDSPAKDRENVNLMDESLYHKMGFQNVSNPATIERLLVKLIESDNRREVFLSDYQEIMESLIMAGVSANASNPNIFNLNLKLFLQESHSHETRVVKALKYFFDKTDTSWPAVDTIWNDKKIDDYLKGMTILMLFNEDVGEKFLDKYGSDQSIIRDFHALLAWYLSTDEGTLGAISHFEKIALTKNIKLERPKFPDWKKINEDRDQLNFDLWFDDERMLNEIQSIFEALKKTELRREDIFDHYKANELTGIDRFSNSSTLTISKMALADLPISFEKLSGWVTQDLSYSDFRIKHIHAELSNKKNLNISEEQISFLRNWCEERGNDKKILWDFINRFDIVVSEDKILDLTNHVSFNYDFKVTERGTIEQLEKFVPLPKIKQRVISNLKNEQLRNLEWTNNAGYALRKNFTTSYPIILKRLENFDNDEYKFQEVLEFWFTKENNVSRLKAFVLKVQSKYLRWNAINLLEQTNSETDFLNKVFRGIIGDATETKEDRLHAAGHLLKLNDVFGMHYIGHYILEQPDPKVDFRIYLGNISLLTDINALGILMALLVLAKRPDFKQDKFNDLEERVMTGLTSMGSKSADNFLAVKSALGQFTAEYQNVFTDLNYFNYSLLKMEEQLKITSSKAPSIKAAIEEYNSI